jgi:group II intron reverse transcriptase/maturase
MGTRRLPRSLSEAELKAVWKTSRDNRGSSSGAPGIDGVSAIDFSKRLSASIYEIRGALRSGHFVFSPLRVCTVPKRNGNKRIIAVPTVRDRLVQRAVCQHLENDRRFPRPLSIAYGFVKGRSLECAHKKALEYRQEAPWVLQTDIVSFFDRIDRNDVLNVVKKTVRSKVIAELIGKVVCTELDYSDPLTMVLTKEHGLQKGRGLRQGMPLSPLLSNLVMREVDRNLEKAGLKAIRYADDIVVFSKSYEAAEDALEVVKELLKPLRLTLPPLSISGKTTITEKRKACEVLGVELRLVGDSYELCAPSRRLNDLQVNFSEISTSEYCSANKITLSRMLGHMEAVVSGHKRSVRGLKNADDFCSRIDSIHQKSIESLLKTIVGEKAYKNLSREKLAILGVMKFD